MQGLDQVKYPGLADYLDALPDGLHSFPDCFTKGSLIRSLLDGRDVEALCVGLPGELQAVVREPPLSGLWAPAVWNDAVFEAVCDAHYPSHAKIHAWTLERTVAVAHKPLYQAILRIPTTSLALRITTKTHRLFQRGSEMEVKSITDGEAVFELHAPRRLHSKRMLYSNAPMFEGIAKLTGATKAQCSMDRWGETGALYTCRWK